MTTTKNLRALTDEVNNVFASRRVRRDSPQQPTVGTKPPVALITREAAEALESHLKRHPIAPAPNDTPFLRGLRRTVAIQKRIADDTQRRLAALAALDAPSVIAPTIEAPMLTDGAPESLPLPVQRPIAPPVMVPRCRR